jgi:hypothetical protein
VRVLRIHNRSSVCRFARLEQQWIAFPGHRSRIQTEHELNHEAALSGTVFG